MRLFNRLPIRTKLYVLVAVAALALIGAIGFAANLLQQRMYADRVDQMRTATDLLAGVASELDNQVKAGKLTQAEALQRFRDAGHAMRYDNGKDFLFATSFDGTMIMHALHPEGEGKKSTTPVVTQLIDSVRDADHAVQSYSVVVTPGTEPQPKLTYVSKFPAWNMIIASGMMVDDIAADYHTALFKLSLSALAMIGVLLAVALVLSHNIAAPLGVLRRQMQQLADGDLAVEIHDDGRTDEIGWMMRAVKVFRENGLAMRRMQEEKADLAVRNQDQQRHKMARLEEEFQAQLGGIVTDVAAAADALQGTAHTMSGVADRSNQQASVVATAAQEASHGVQSVAAATEELTSSIAEISRQVQHSSQVVARAVQDARHTDKVVRQLAESAGKIGEVVNLISSIASQTNLLALNATIEAARAGDAGNGFAVVASEVKNLATQTGRATEDIGAQISQIQTVTQQAVTAIQGIVDVISEADGIATTIAAAVEEQGAATKEISRSVQEAADGTREVSANIAGVSRAAEDAGAASAQVLGAATDLSKNSVRLGDAVRVFLTGIRAA